MKNPIRLIRDISICTDKLFIWSHYYDEGIIRSNPSLTSKFKKNSVLSEDGFTCTLYRQEYQNALNWSGFCGGSDTYSHWLSRHDLLACLEYFGFNHIEVESDALEHPNGPCFTLYAAKK